MIGLEKALAKKLITSYRLSIKINKIVKKMEKSKDVTDIQEILTDFHRTLTPLTMPIGDNDVSELIKMICDESIDEEGIIKFIYKCHIENMLQPTGEAPF